MLGQLSWLSEQAGAGRRVLALDAAQEQISDQTSEQVRLLAKIKQALSERGVVLYAQPIRMPAEKGTMRYLAVCAAVIPSLRPIGLFH